MQISAFFFTIDFDSEPILKILTFLHIFSKKCVKPKIGLNGKKMKKQMA
jgi:hypothetical protein